MTSLANPLGLAFRCRQEGAQVRMYCHDRTDKSIGRGLVEPCNDWRAWLRWADLVVFDDTRLKMDGQPDFGGGEWADEVRRRGIPVVGGTPATDDMEQERSAGERAWEKLIGIHGEKMHTFKGPGAWEAARQFVRANPGAWALKNNAAVPKFMAGVQWSEEEMCDFLDWHESVWPVFGEGQKPDFVLQPAVRGIEISTTGAFDGHDWRGVFLLQEKKRMMPGDYGPMTGCAGEVAHPQASSKLFLSGMAKMTDWLRKQRYTGYIDLSFIATEDRIVPLEWTTRFGYGSIYNVMTLSDCSVCDWLWTMATGEGKVPIKQGWGCFFTVGSGTYPFSDPKRNKGIRILGDWWGPDVWLSSVQLDPKADGALTIAGNLGHLLYCTGYGRDLASARDAARATLKSIRVLPQPTVRDDIGRYFANDWQRLQEWGWVN